MSSIDMQPPSHQIWQATPNHRADLDFGTIVRRWERLRIVYNAILIPWTIVLLLISTGPPAIIVLVPIGGILANVLYLLGPAVESYMTWFGVWHVALTVILFLAGLAVTGAAAAVVLLQLPI